MLSAGLQPNLVTFNTLLEVYAKQGMWREAVGVLDTLEQQRLVPEPRTFNIVMNACNSVGQFSECITVHDRMVEQSVAPTVGTYNAVLLAYCKCVCGSRAGEGGQGTGRGLLAPVVLSTEAGHTGATLAAAPQTDAACLAH